MPIRGEATARLADGDTLTLAVNFATLARAAAQVAIPAGELFKVLRDAKDARQMLAMLALTEQALKRHHPDIDEDALGDLMLTDGEAIGAALNTATAGAFGDDDTEDGDEKNPPIRGTGTPSKASGQKRAKRPATSGSRRRAAM
jgi:hypothetical protein